MGTQVSLAAESRTVQQNESTALDSVGERRACWTKREHCSHFLTRRHTMTKTYVIVGAGPVGRHTAEVLRERGDEVRLVTRSGRVQLDGVESVAADASDPEALTRSDRGCRGPVQLRQPHRLHHLGAGLAAAGREPADRGRTDRGDAGDRLLPLPVRSDRRTDGRGAAGRGDRPQGPAAGGHVGRGEVAARGRSAAGGRGARCRLRGRRGRRQRPHHPASGRRRRRARPPG